MVDVVPVLVAATAGTTERTSAKLSLHTYLCTVADNDYPVGDVDPRSLKALAHPLRMRLLALLRTEGAATSAGLARRVDESTGATSYHLRQLERHDFVEEEPERGTRRERWWRARHPLSRFDTAAFLADPATADAATFMQRYQLDMEVRLTQRWLSEQPSWSPSWQSAATSSDWLIRLSDEQLAELKTDLEQVLEHYRAAEQPRGTPGTEPTAVFVRAFPTDPGLF